MTFVKNHFGIKLSYDPAMLLLGTSPKGLKIRIQIGVWTLMFVTAGVTISRKAEATRWSTARWMSNWGPSARWMEHHSALKEAKFPRMARRG